MIDNSLIEKYFSNCLSNEELKEFESLYNNNVEFKKEVDFLANIKIVSGLEDNESFKTTLKSFESQKKHKNLFSINPYTITTVAAILIIGLFISFYWVNKPNSNDLFATYFEPSINVSVPIVRSEDSQNITNEAFIAYAEKDYKNASILFEKAYNSNNNNSELLFYEGNALLASGSTKDAIEKFKNHLKFQDSLTNRSHWYLALAYLKMNDLDNAKKQLDIFINTTENFKKEDAKSLLNKLK